MGIVPVTFTEIGSFRISGYLNFRAMLSFFQDSLEVPQG